MVPEGSSQLFSRRGLN